MPTRDEYVDKLKDQLDRWNADMARWEAQAHSARAGAEKEYARQLDILRDRREEAQYQLKLLQGATVAGWSDLARGADEAWARLREAIAQASTHFEKR